jgi:hypothetical protein
MSHWTSANTNNRARLARALSTDTGVGYQKCLRVVTGVADAGLLPAFTTDMDASVRALAPLVLAQSAKGKKMKPSWGTRKAAWQVATTEAAPPADGPFKDGVWAKFSPHAALAANRAPGVAITGAPGAGKSFLAFRLAYEMVLDGVQTVYIDPKADAVPLARVEGMEDTKVLHLRNADDGMLDPFGFTDDIKESQLLALETVRMLMGGRMPGDREEVLIAAIQKVSAEPDPSLGRVVDVLRTNPESAAAHSLGLTLDVMRKLPFAPLYFNKRTGTPTGLSDTLTIITMLGLDLPTSGCAPEDYSYENRLAMSVMYLLTAYVRQTLLDADRTRPNAVLIDEAWTVTATDAGSDMILNFGRMQRRTNTAVVLVTQNANDLLNTRVRNMFSTVFGFRTINADEVNGLLDLLGVDGREEHRRTVEYLFNGECLMRDLNDEVTRVKVDLLPEDVILAAFSGNPDPARLRQR